MANFRSSPFFSRKAFIASASQHKAKRLSKFETYNLIHTKTLEFTMQNQPIKTNYKSI